MIRKKLLKITLITTIAATLLVSAGCGKKAADNNTIQETKATVSTETKSVAAKEPTKTRMNINGSERTGVLDILGAVSDKESVSYDALTDIGTTESIVSQPKPVITYTQPDVIKRNTAVNLLGCFSVTEYNGNDYVTDNAFSKYPDKVYIKSILKDDRTTSVMNLYDETTGNIIFADSGVYFVTFALRDDENRENIMTVRIPVRLEEV
mgnify:CR=1 FL=1